MGNALQGTKINYFIDDFFKMPNQLRKLYYKNNLNYGFDIGNKVP